MTVSRAIGPIALAVSAALFVSLPAATAQDEGKTAETQAQTGDPAVQQPDEGSLEDLKRQWSEVDAKIKEKADAYNASESEDEQRAIRNEYELLVTQANELIGRLKTAAVAAIDQDPNNEETMKLIVGIMINDAAFDRDADVLSLGDEVISRGVPVEYFEVASKADRLSIAAREIFEELLIRQREAEAGDLPQVKISTDKGGILIELFENEAPQTVGNFVKLVEDGYYDGLTFHRVLDGFMAQAGCPKGDGTGGPGYTIYCECYKPEARRHFTGSLSMAKGRQRNSGGSQFFLTFARTTHLDGQHTVFGRVIDGMDVVNSIQRVNPDDPNKPAPDKIIIAEVVRKRDHEYQPTKVGEATGN